MIKKDFETAIRKFIDVEMFSTGEPLEAATERLESFAPHSYLTDLIFYAEIDRTDEEIVEEAIIREQIWETAGDEGVIARIKNQMLAALNNPAASIANQHSARAILNSLNSDAK